MGATVAVVLVAAWLAGAAGPAGAVEVVPHRAFYIMSLAAADSRSNIADVEGAMLFEWADSCDGWAVTQKLAMTVYYSTGELSEFGWNLTSWESKDGSILSSSAARRMAPKRCRCAATPSSTGRAREARRTTSNRRSAHVDLPAGALFPTAHSLALLAEAEAGTPFFFSDVFDGSDEDGLFGVGAIIGKRIPPERVKTAAPRSSLRRHPGGSGSPSSLTPTRPPSPSTSRSSACTATASRRSWCSTMATSRSAPRWARWKSCRSPAAERRAMLPQRDH